MDLGTILGLVIGFGLIIGAMMLGGGVMSFVDAQSAMIVIGGFLTASRRAWYVSGVRGGCS